MTEPESSVSKLSYASTASMPIAHDNVTVTVPAVGTYLALLRMVTAGLAARLDFNVDEIEDLKIAIDEACAMLLSQAVPGSSVQVSFAVESETLAIEVSVPTLDGLPPSRDTFAWTVLAALAGDVDSRVDLEKVVTVTLRKSRSGSE